MSERLKPCVVLDECAALIEKKSNDYQNPNSTIVQSDYYPRGVASILDIMHAKVLRMRSVLEAMENDSEYAQNFESLEDSAKDLINYSAFFVTYCRGELQGQDGSRDFLNKPAKVTTGPTDSAKEENKDNNLSKNAKIAEEFLKLTERMKDPLNTDPFRKPRIELSPFDIRNYQSK